MAKKQQQPEEDYPGQRREIRLHNAIRKAVDTADKIILEASDGSVEETDYLTLKVAEAFFNKVGFGVIRIYNKKLFT